MAASLFSWFVQDPDLPIATVERQRYSSCHADQEVSSTARHQKPFGKAFGVDGLFRHAQRTFHLRAIGREIP